MNKKIYSQPTLTDHGSVVEVTKGAIGYSFEPMGRMWWEEDSAQSTSKQK